MKNLKYILLILNILLLTSCEEVVDVDLDTAPPRLVVEASIDWEKGTTGINQTIKLTTTTGYYSTEIPTVSGATVVVTDGNAVFNFIENAQGSGLYLCTNFIPVLGHTYTLTVMSGGQTYTATETMMQSPDITYTTQAEEGGILGDEIEIRYYYNDIPDQTNFYLTRATSYVIPVPEYDINSDEFTENNEMFEFFSDEDLKAGDIVNVKLYGISERYYRFMNILLEAAGGGGNPFQGVPTMARGNLVNQTDESNYALGYFRVCQVTNLDITIQ